MDNRENEKIEIDLLIRAIYLKYGYDFSDYSKASIRRRVLGRLSKSGFSTISEMQHDLLYNPDFFEKLLLDLTVNVSEMFRDPLFFKAVRKTVIPELKKRHFLKVWHAGCSTGEEVYSMAILLREEGVLDASTIYATDVNEAVLDKAKKGIFPIDRMKDYTRNYKMAGGLASFADYYTARYDRTIMDRDLKSSIVFSDHNLVTDAVFGEMDLIICRNVLIYFNRDLQDRVFGLFSESLRVGGFLCLGSKESMMFSKHAKYFESIVKKEKIYRRIEI